MSTLTDSTATSLVPANTPFNFNLGINYESWNGGRIGYSISADLDQITQYFRLVKTFHDAAVGTSDPTSPTIDPTQQEVISYVVAHSGMQLVMGTNNNALANGGFGTPWTPGLMTSVAYTDQWVQMIIQAFGSKEAVESQLQMILLGNEVDANGPPLSDPSFADYQAWINQSFSNLQTSLANAGLGSIPISTTIANYGPTNAIAVGTTDYIQTHWSAGWNSGSPIVLFNQYTPADGSGHEAATTNYASVIDYFNSIETTLNGAVEPFVGETGYSTYYGEPNQSDVYQQIFAWLDAQYAQDHKTVPLFAFDAFDQPGNADPVQAQYGIFSQGGSFAPTGLKAGITLPLWTATPIDTMFGTSGSDSLVGRSGHTSFFGGMGNDTIVGAGGDNTAIYWDLSKNFVLSVIAGQEAITVHDKAGHDGTDSLFNVQFLQFSDQTLDATSFVKAAALSAAEFAPLIQVYGAYLDRAPDAIGLSYWASRLGDGMSMADIAASFYASNEAQVGQQPMSTGETVIHAYNDVLGRAPDASGFDYWLGELASGQIAPDLLPLAIVLGALAPTGSSTDALYVSNQTNVGAHFALVQGLSNLDQARAVLDAVDATATSVVGANQLTDTFAAAAALPNSSELVVQLVGMAL